MKPKHYDMPISVTNVSHDLMRLAVENKVQNFKSMM